MTARKMVEKLIDLRVKKTEIIKKSGVCTRTINSILEGNETDKSTDKKIAAAYEAFKAEIQAKAGEL